MNPISETLREDLEATPAGKAGREAAASLRSTDGPLPASLIAVTAETVAENQGLESWQVLIGIQKSLELEHGMAFAWADEILAHWSRPRRKR